MKPEKKLRILLAEDSALTIYLYQHLLNSLVGDQRGLLQEYIPECSGFDISLTTVSARNPKDAFGYLGQDGAHFDAVLSDGTGWFPFAIEAQKRFSVIGCTGDPEMVLAFKEAGIPCYLKAGSSSSEIKNIEQVCVEVIRTGLGLPGL